VWGVYLYTPTHEVDYFIVLTANSTSSALTVFLPACFASLTAASAIFSPFASRAFASASLASLLIL